MDNQKWMLSVESRLARIDANVENILGRMPVCDKQNIEEKVNMNRKLIILILTSIIVTIFTVIGEKLT